MRRAPAFYRPHGGKNGARVLYAQLDYYEAAVNVRYVIKGANWGVGAAKEELGCR